MTATSHDKILELVDARDKEFMMIVLTEAKKFGKEKDVHFELEYMDAEGTVPFDAESLGQKDSFVKETAWWEVYDYCGDVLIEELSAKLCSVENGSASDYCFDKEELRKEVKRLFEKTHKTETKYIPEEEEEQC